MQFQENAQADGRTDGRSDRPYFIGPFRLTPMKAPSSKEQQEIFQYILNQGCTLACPANFSYASRAQEQNYVFIQIGASTSTHVL